MTKFIDLGRRNIADAIGHSLYISTTAGIAGDFETRSGGEAVYAECLQSGNNCYALEGYAPTGDYAGYMYGGKGVYAESDDAAQPGLDGNAYGGQCVWRRWRERRLPRRLLQVRQQRPSIPSTWTMWTARPGYSGAECARHHTRRRQSRHRRLQSAATS